MTLSHRRQTAFSLVELMVVVALVAILVAVATPSLVGLIQSNRVTAEVNSFVGDLQYARSEAIKQGVPVSVCASSDGLTCLGTNTWQSGWIVFVDLDGSGTVNAGDTVLRKRPAWVGGDTFAAAPSISAVTYSRDGFANLPVAATGASIVLALHTAPVNASATRCVSINRVGHQTVVPGGTGACA
ncbi:GspH/FimT family pseudopilin [Variovorax sp. EL159]|uniref:GspH/FimT family pseudopilin n=1 Tax=Variovorax sp. EL159 TaxID=1566270 RepID=UPI00088C492A|nr:GspH/FimT family pseudopilin [Variovorax sp. EL159]SCX73954.1 type IV fimbrial biogenesis protein FimT [Variovorax sp. EL159]